MGKMFEGMGMNAGLGDHGFDGAMKGMYDEMHSEFSGWYGENTEDGKYFGVYGDALFDDKTDDEWMNFFGDKGVGSILDASFDGSAIEDDLYFGFAYLFDGINPAKIDECSDHANHDHHRRALQDEPNDDEDDTNETEEEKDADDENEWGHWEWNESCEAKIQEKEMELFNVLGLSLDFVNDPTLAMACPMGALDTSDACLLAQQALISMSLMTASDTILEGD